MVPKGMHHGVGETEGSLRAKRCMVFSAKEATTPIVSKLTKGPNLPYQELKEESQNQ